MAFWVNGAVRAALTTGGILAALPASAEEYGRPVPWNITLQPTVTDLGHFAIWFGDFTLAIVALITLLVLGLLVYVMWRFNAKRHPVPSRTSHNTVIEVLWTVLPILILCAIAVPSFRLLYQQLEIPPADLTVKATGIQWYWNYEYPDAQGVAFDSFMVRGAGDKPAPGPKGEPRTLAVDNPMVVPVNKIVRMQITANDVIHAWTVPAFGMKMDGYPGRLNEMWFRAERPGIYFGQCSELCGRDHAYMPIAVRVVTDEQFQAWLEAAKSDITQANELLVEMIKRDKATNVATR